MPCSRGPPVRSATVSDDDLVEGLVETLWARKRSNGREQMCHPSLEQTTDAPVGVYEDVTVGR